MNATADIVRKFAVEHPQVRLVSHPENLGYGHAVRTGLSASRGDAVAFIDGDRQFHVSDLHLLIDVFADADLVAGRRIHRADPWHRLAIARVYKIVLDTFFGLHVKDPDCAFKLFSREIVEKVVPQLESRAAFVSPELLIRSKLGGYRLVEVPVPHHPRIAGRPKGAPPKVILRTISELVRLRRSLRGAAVDARGTSSADRP
jgi:glycosyltransferase involved in cell wall biosynthesis